MSPCCLSRLLLVCLDDNVGSITTIERHAGVLEKVLLEDHGLVRHCCIDV
jgi:predicted acetyltransferase